MVVFSAGAEALCCPGLRIWRERIGGVTWGRGHSFTGRAVSVRMRALASASRRHNAKRTVSARIAARSAATTAQLKATSAAITSNAATNPRIMTSLSSACVTAP